MGSDLLKVYLGRDAGERVLSGEIQRGSTQNIDAVVFLFDLNGFTALSERLPGYEVVEMLNSYLDHVIDVVQAHGGNILKFLGDGVLAMFNLGTLEADARAALDAAAALQARLLQANARRAEEGRPHAGYRVTLHAGEILYGNIGAENRLDFTVIGPTVNLTARMSDLHKAVEREVLLSEHVLRAAGTVPHDLVSVGRYMLRGVAAPIEMFTIYLADVGSEGGSSTSPPTSAEQCS
jgi:adenylate cyclase